MRCSAHWCRAVCFRAHRPKIPRRWKYARLLRDCRAMGRRDQSARGAVGVRLESISVQAARAALRILSTWPSLLNTFPLFFSLFFIHSIYRRILSRKRVDFLVLVFSSSLILAPFKTVCNRHPATRSAVLPGPWVAVAGRLRVGRAAWPYRTRRDPDTGPPLNSLYHFL